MKIADLNEWLSLLANVGVLIGIIFLIVELQQTNRIARVSAEYEIRNNFSALNELNMSDPEYAEWIVGINQPDTVLDGTDEWRTRNVIARLWNVMQAASVSYENGIASETLYRNMLDDARLNIQNSSPAARVLWRQQLDAYPSLESTDLAQYIYGLLDNYDEFGREI